jgi:hypothetical protein
MLSVGTFVPQTLKEIVTIIYSALLPEIEPATGGFAQSLSESCWMELSLLAVATVGLTLATRSGLSGG